MSLDVLLAQSEILDAPASNYIMHEILGLSDKYNAIFIYGKLDEYLVSCLKDPERRKLIRQRVTHMFIEMKTMYALQGIKPGDLTDAEVATLHWLYLMYRFQDNMHLGYPGLRTLFNCDFYADPCGVMKQSVKHFGGVLRDEDAQSIHRGHVFSKHSKGSTRAFSMEMRESSLKLARQKYEYEVATGLEWAQRITDRYPLRAHPEMSPLS